MINGANPIDRDRVAALAKAISICLKAWDSGESVLIVRLPAGFDQAQYDAVRCRIHDLLDGYTAGGDPEGA